MGNKIGTHNPIDLELFGQVDIETHKPEIVKFFIGVDELRQIGNLSDPIPKIPNKLLNTLSKPSPFDSDWKKPVGENHLLILIPGHMHDLTEMPDLEAENDPEMTINPQTYYREIDTWMDPIANISKWFLVPLNQQIVYSKENPDFPIEHKGPEGSGLTYLPVPVYSEFIQYIILQHLREVFPETQIRFNRVESTGFLPYNKNVLWALSADTK